MAALPKVAYTMTVTVIVRVFPETRPTSPPCASAWHRGRRPNRPRRGVRALLQLVSRQERLPYGLGANGVVGRIADGKRQIRQPTVVLEVIDKQGGRRGAITEHQRAGSTVKRSHIGVARINLSLQGAGGVRLASSRGGHDAVTKTPLDSAISREQYGRRFATVEPVFANLRHNKLLDRFTLRGRTKVDGQWKLFCLAHNIEKLAHAGPAA